MFARCWLPFGKPVVPEVQLITAASFTPSTTTGLKVGWNWVSFGMKQESPSIINKFTYTKAFSR